MQKGKKSYLFELGSVWKQVLDAWSTAHHIKYPQREKYALYSKTGKYFALLLLFPTSTTSLPILFYFCFAET